MVPSRDTAFGLVILGVLVIGALWAGEWSGPTESSATGAGASPDVTLDDRTVDLGAVRLTLSVTPRPVTPLARHRYRVRVASAAGPLSLDGGRISFEMDMPMGDHRYTLVAAPDGWYEAEVALPACQSGRRRWYAAVEVQVSGERRTATFVLDLRPPGAGSAP